MANKKLWFVMLVITLVFGLTVVGCDNGTTSKGGDTWSNITSFSQLDGTWKSSYSQNNKPVKQLLEEYGMEWDSTMEGMFGNMRVTSGTDITITIDAVNKTQKTSMKSTETFSGGNIETLWTVLSMYLEMYLESLEEGGVTITDINNNKHSISMEYSSDAQPISDEDIDEMLNSGLKINQDGTKMKMPKNSLEGGVTTPELIFIKQQ
jgi:hypothetical protein